jgi:transcriptional regulator with XRE-family HTH domain
MLQITRERHRRRLSQAKLARRAQLDQSIVSKVESGRLRPYPCQLRRLARALGIPREVAPKLLEEVEIVSSAASLEVVSLGANAETVEPKRATTADRASLRERRITEPPDDAA